MAISIRHKFATAVPDLPNSDLVQPSHWNDDHTITLAANTLLGRADGEGPAEEIDLTAAGRALLDDISAAAQRATLGLGETDAPTFGGFFLNGVGGLTAGSAAAPSLVRTGDTNTGMWFPAVDTIAFSTNGVERFRITSTGSINVNVPGGNFGLELGLGRASDGDTFIDLVGDRTYTDYGSRFIRQSGANGGSGILHRGTGGLFLRAQDAGFIQLLTNNVERLLIDPNGNIGIGTTFTTARTLNVRKNLTGGTNAFGVVSGGDVQSDVTSAAYAFYTALSTVNQAFTTQLRHFSASQGTIGASSTVSNQYGFFADSSLIGATFNYGFHAADLAAVTTGKTAIAYWSSVNIATGGGQAWAFYANGTAPSFFNGQVQFGAGLVGTPAISRSGDTNTGFWFPAADTIALSTGGVERLRADASGNVVMNSAALAANATNGFLYVPSCAGAPTGVPTAYTGRVPIVVDTTNNKLYFYSGGAWRAAP